MKNKKDLMPARIKRAEKKLEILSHTHVRKRDSINTGIIGGICCTCGKYCESGNFQAGHRRPSGGSGWWLKYHPHNMFGQGGYCCNLNRNGQQKMGDDFALYFIKRFSFEYCERLNKISHTTLYIPVQKIVFLETMIEKYETGDEQQVVDYLEDIYKMATQYSV